MDCGVKYPYYVMQLDHRDPMTKNRKLSKLQGWPLATIERELAKCDVVCANCHAERSYSKGHHLLQNGRLPEPVYQGLLWDSL